jgi:DNA-binding NarL/FixJ family response regulator
MIRILLLAPQPLLGACVHALLSERPDMKIVGTERDLGHAVAQARELRPDVVIANCRDTALDDIVMQLLK